MKRTITFALSVLGITLILSSCVSNTKYADLMDQNRRLQEQIAKERDENAQLASFRFSLENQFREKSKQYEDCKEDNKENIEAMAKKYDQILNDYKKLEASYKELNVLLQGTKESDARIIEDLNERLRQSYLKPSRRRRG
jgi:hypothetical protein